MKFSSLRYLVSQGIKNMWNNRVMGLASFCVLMVSLLLIGFSVLFIANINSLINIIETKNEMVIYIKEEVNEEDAKKMQASLEKLDNISEIKFVSKEEALDILYNGMKNYQSLYEELENDYDFLPFSYNIKIKDVSKITETVEAIQKIDNVDTVYAPYDFANVLTNLRKIFSIISTTVLIALATVSIVIISNSTRASVFSRRKEINIMKYVGATDSFIRIPFFIEGFFTGILAGITATFITWFGYKSMIEALTAEVSMWNIIGVGGLLAYQDIDIIVVTSYILTGAFLGAIGSVISTTKHLKV